MTRARGYVARDGYLIEADLKFEDIDGPAIIVRPNRDPTDTIQLAGTEVDRFSWAVTYDVACMQAVAQIERRMRTAERELEEQERIARRTRAYETPHQAALRALRASEGLVHDDDPVRVARDRLEGLRWQRMKIRGEGPWIWRLHG